MISMLLFLVLIYYQSHHKGIETDLFKLKGGESPPTNRTIKELKLQ